MGPLPGNLEYPSAVTAVKPKGKTGRRRPRETRRRNMENDMKRLQLRWNKFIRRPKVRGCRKLLVRGLHLAKGEGH